MLDNLIVGNQIACLRKQKGFTQEELAEKLGVSAQAISKWENGHSLPETALLPLLAAFFACSIDSILLPFSAQDSVFDDFVRNISGNQGELALEIYQKIKGKFNFTINYEKEFVVGDTTNDGLSATFMNPDGQDFLLRIDAEKRTSGGDNNLYIRLPLPNCSKYMHLIDSMPEYVKEKFRCNDCKHCRHWKPCQVAMIYKFEGVNYQQCHFVTFELNTAENMAHILRLIYAEQGCKPRI